jgi:hypothetical protein
VEPVEASVAVALRQLVEWVVLPPDQAGPIIARAGLPSDGAAGWEGISPFVTSSVTWSLYCFLRTPEDYWETICTAIAVGGDVDSTASMAGAISGAHLGLEALPQSLAFALADQGTWGFSDLVELAHQCYDVQRKPG